MLLLSIPPFGSKFNILRIRSSPAAATLPEFPKGKGEAAETRRLFGNVEAPSTKPFLGMLIGRAADALDLDSRVYRLGKCRKFDNSG